MSITESGFDKTLGFLQSEEFDKLIAATKEFWDECDYMGNPGASEKEIDKLAKKFKKLYSVPAPEGYIAFMKKLKGFKYNKFDIYPCGMAAAVNEKGDPYFIFGHDDKNRLAYNPETGKYVILKIDYRAFEMSVTPVIGHDTKGRPVRVKKAETKGSVAKCEVIETYESFADLFKTVMMYTLPDDKLQKIYPELKGWT